MTSSILLRASRSPLPSPLGRAPHALACALALAWAAPAGAASPASQPAAKSAFAAAQRAYALGKFDEAIAGYSKAYDLSERPALLFNIAQCHRQLKDFKRAAFFYQRYLSLQPAPIENEELARSLLAEMEQAMAAQETTQALPEPLPPPKPAPEAAPAEAIAPPPAPATDAESPRPLLKQWWLWTAVGAAAVGAAVTVGVLATRDHPASTSLGEIRF